MNIHYVILVIVIPYHGFGVFISIVSKEDSAYCVTVGNILHCTCLDFTEMPSHALGKKGKWVYYKHLCYVFRFMFKVDYETHNSRSNLHI